MERTYKFTHGDIEVTFRTKNLAYAIKVFEIFMRAMGEARIPMMVICE